MRSKNKIIKKKRANCSFFNLFLVGFELSFFFLAFIWIAKQKSNITKNGSKNVSSYFSSAHKQIMAEIDYAVRAFKQNLSDLVNSRNYHVTQEIYAEVKGVTSALDSVKMDNMFLTKSHKWSNQFDQSKLQHEKRGLRCFTSHFLLLP